MDVGDGAAARDASSPGAGWPDRGLSWRALAAVAVFAAGGLLAGGWAVAGLLDGDWAPVLFGAVAAVQMSALAGLVVRSRSRGSGTVSGLGRWPADGTPAVRFGYSIAAYCWFSLLVGGCVLLVLLVGLAVGSVVGVVVAGVGVLLGWYLAVMFRHAPGALLLSPAGVAHRGLTSFHSVPWVAVHGVEAGWTGTSALVVRAYASPQTALRRYTGWFDTGESRYLPDLMVRTYWLAADREVVRQALAFYLAHPELRGELSTPEAVRRIVEGRTGT